MDLGPLVGSSEVGDIYSVGTDFCFRMPDLRRLDEEVDELMGSGVPTTQGTSACASEKKFGERLLRIWIRPTGSRPDGERESRGPVGLGHGICYQ